MNFEDVIAAVGGCEGTLCWIWSGIVIKMFTLRESDEKKRRRNVTDSRKGQRATQETRGYYGAPLKIDFLYHDNA